MANAMQPSSLAAVSGRCVCVDRVLGIIIEVEFLVFYAKPDKFWVESSQKRYVPYVKDHVLGIVVDTKADNFLVDIKGPAIAFLPVLAFEGGTRRNIPKYEVGTLLYVRVVKANTGMNPELSCMDANGKASGFGILKDGYMFESSTGLSRVLLSSPTCPVLDILWGKNSPLK
ncbi:unnamed protein product [Rhodiola kirilowii]